MAAATVDDTKRAWPPQTGGTVGDHVVLMLCLIPL